MTTRWTILVASALMVSVTPTSGQQTAKSVIDAINSAVSHDDQQAFSKLFTSDGDLWIGGKPVPLDRYFEARGIWTERTAPVLIFKSLRMLTPEVALADATRKQYGAMVMSSIPVMLVLTHTSGEWRISTMRLHDSGYPFIRPAVLKQSAVRETCPHSRFPPGSAAKAG